MHNAVAKPMTLMDHIRELRMRLFIVAAVFLLGSMMAYVLRDSVVHVLLDPLKGQKLVYLSVAGGFNFVFQISIYAGLALAAPILIQQLYAFVRPVLPKKIQKYSVRIFFSSLCLLSAGIVFGYYCAIPGALNFLYSFADNYVQASLTADSYLSFIISYTLGLGLVFQLPLVLLFIHWVKPLKPGGLLRSERWVILLAFIAAAIITPTPDPINQTVMALPIIAVYQIGVVAVLVSIAREGRRRRLAAVSTMHEAVVPSVLVQTQPVRRTAVLTVPMVAQAAAATRPSTRPSTRRPSLDGMMARPRATSLGMAKPIQSHQPSILASKSMASQVNRSSRGGLAIDGILPRLSAT